MDESLFTKVDPLDESLFEGRSKVDPLDSLFEGRPKVDPLDELLLE